MNKLLMKPNVKPILISPIPSVAPAAAPRPMSMKRISRVRLSWFVIGSAFGIGASFFMNFLLTSVVLPEYNAVMARGKDAAVVETTQAKKQEEADKEQNIAAIAASATPVAPAETEITYPRTLALEVSKGDTLLDMLIAHRVQASEAQQVINALKPQFNAQKLRVGQKISVTLQRHEKLGDKAAVKELAINLPNLSTVELERLEGGKFNVAATKEELTAHAHRAYGRVRTSLLQAGNDANIPSGTMNEIIKAFSYDVDFQRDIHPGDSIEALMARNESKDGRIGGYSDVRYAALTLRGKKMEIFRFKDSSGDYAWYDAKGNSVKKSLLRTPVEAAHITSGFGMRTHPIMGYTKFHRGVDFGAGTGTPIMAAGDGVVTFKGWKSGYGNFVVIKHNGAYETAYGHCSRFGKISVGSRVKQGQVIAYVGMTGMATGPHLHYEVRQNNVQVNPVSKQFNMASGLTGKQLAAFKATKDSVLKEMAALKPAEQKTEAKVASR